MTRSKSNKKTSTISKSNSRNEISTPKNVCTYTEMNSIGSAQDKKVHFQKSNVCNGNIDASMRQDTDVESEDQHCLMDKEISNKELSVEKHNTTEDENNSMNVDDHDDTNDDDNHVGANNNDDEFDDLSSEIEKKRKESERQMIEHDSGLVKGLLIEISFEHSDNKD